MRNKKLKFLSCYPIIEDMFNITSDWESVLKPIFDKHIHIFQDVEQDIKNCEDILSIFPPQDMIMNAFMHCRLSNLKVVLIGQDPYHNKGQAHGLAFSVPFGIKAPPSLVNVFKELERCYGIHRVNTDLTDWADQGVLLLNTALTVREGCPGSHVKIWKEFTNDLIKKIGSMEGIVFILWGNHAQSYAEYIDGTKNLVLKHSHPSPLSRKPFTGNDHFILCNNYLKSLGKTEIKWC